MVSAVVAGERGVPSVWPRLSKYTRPYEAGGDQGAEHDANGRVYLPKTASIKRDKNEITAGKEDKIRQQWQNTQKEEGRKRKKEILMTRFWPVALSKSNYCCADDGAV